MLQDFLEAISTMPEDELKTFGWDPSGHEALEMHRIVSEWEDHIARW